MGHHLKMTVQADWGWLDDYMAEITNGTGASTVVTTAARRGIDKYIRKVTGQLAGEVGMYPVQENHWQLTYTAPYAGAVWSLPIQPGNSINNKNATPDPHEQPEVALTVATDLAIYAAKI